MRPLAGAVCLGLNYKSKRRLKWRLFLYRRYVGISFVLIMSARLLRVRLTFFLRLCFFLVDHLSNLDARTFTRKSLKASKNPLKTSMINNVSLRLESIPPPAFYAYARSLYT